MKVSGEWREQNNGGNDHRKYSSRGFEQHLPSAVSVAVDGVLFFVILLNLLFENKCQKKRKLKVSGEWTEQKNGGKYNCK